MAQLGSTPRIETEQEEGLYLVTMQTCPQCKQAKEALLQAGLHYHLLMAEEHRHLAKRWQIFLAPTLVRVADGMAVNYRGMAEIQAYLASQSNEV